MPTTKTNIEKSFGSSDPGRNNKKEAVCNKVYSTNPGPGEYDVHVRKKSFNMKGLGFLGPRPKRILGVEVAGSIYEDPTAKYPAPTRYQPHSTVLNVIAQPSLSAKKLSTFYESFDGGSPKRRKGRGRIDPEGSEEGEPYSPARASTDLMRRSLPVSSTLPLSKYGSPHGVILDTPHKRWQIDDVLRYRK
jgi:hypothetical protein